MDAIKASMPEGMDMMSMGGKDGMDMEKMQAMMGGGGGGMGGGMGGMGGGGGPPPPPARAKPVKADVKYIKCEVCQEAVKQLYR